MESKIRRYRNNMYISGMGVIIMGVWSCIKFLMEMLMGDFNIMELIDGQGIDPELLKIIVFVTVAIILVLSFLLTYYIGIKAMKEARGKKVRPFFLFWILVAIFITLTGIPGYFNEDQRPRNLDVILASILVDLTFTLMLGDIFVSHFMIKKLTKEGPVIE